MEIAGIFIAFGFLILLGAILFKILQPKLKGKAGEIYVSTYIKRFFPNAIIVDDVLIPTKNGTTQIDHIVIMNGGIVVVETKNYGGKIYGNDNMEYWQQFIGKQKNKFFSPVFQNNGHINALKKLVDEPIPYYNFVVFANCEKLLATSKNAFVGYIYETKSILKKIEKNYVLSQNHMKDIQNKILSHNIISKEARKEHIAYIKNKYKDCN